MFKLLLDSKISAIGVYIFFLSPEIILLSSCPYFLSINGAMQLWGGGIQNLDYHLAQTPLSYSNVVTYIFDICF